MEPIDLTKYVLDISLKVEKLQVEVLVALIFRGVSQELHRFLAFGKMILKASVHRPGGSRLLQTLLMYHQLLLDEKRDAAIVFAGSNDHCADNVPRGPESVFEPVDKGSMLNHSMPVILLQAFFPPLSLCVTWQFVPHRRNEDRTSGGIPTKFVEDAQITEGCTTHTVVRDAM